MTDGTLFRRVFGIWLHDARSFSPDGARHLWRWAHQPGAPPPFARSCRALALDARTNREIAIPMKLVSTCLDTFWSNVSAAFPATLPMPAHVCANDLPPAERIAYALINHAAEFGEPCPVNIDLEVATGFNSSSMGPKLVRKLENRGLIRVSRFQRFRLVEIVATGKQTARHPSMQTDRPLVRRGARSAAARGLPADRKPYAAR